MKVIPDLREGGQAIGRGDHYRDERYAKQQRVLV